VTNYILSHFN